MKRQALAFVLCAFLAGLGSVACKRTERGVEAAGDRTDRSNVLTTADRDFIWKAADSHQQEINMAQIAEEKSTNSDVKDFASMLEKDHKSALKDLNSLMDKYNAPRAGGEQPREHASVDRLNNLDSSQFDRMFLDMMVESHQKALAAYRTEAGTVQNAHLKEHVNDTIPTIEKHLNRAQQLQSQH